MKRIEQTTCKPRRIALTGGPGGGKTTAADLFQRELGGRVVLVPESATLLFSGRFPRLSIPAAREAAQRAIYHVQRSAEELAELQSPGRILLCDRGTIDGAAYWPNSSDDFFTAMHSSHQAELARYDAVLFFESAAVGGLDVESGNPCRIESVGEAAALDAELRALWKSHPGFVLVKHQPSFFDKLRIGLREIHRLVDELDGTKDPRALARSIEPVNDV